MQELNRLQSIVIACVVGVVLSFGGAVYSAVKTTREKKALELPASQIPVPATAQ
jgi:ABC-type enterobactin transport system permease subunit